MKSFPKMFVYSWILIIAISVMGFSPIQETQLHFPENTYMPSAEEYPTYSWHAFYGSSTLPDISSDITADAQGNLYLVGTSYASWNGPANEAPLNPYSLEGNIAVVKLNSSGQYQWHTFYGFTTPASGYIVPTGIEIDNTGHIYIIGKTTSSWNVSGVPPLNAFGGIYENLFILKLDGSGAYQWHTFYHTASNVDVNMSLQGNSIYITGTSVETWNGPSGQSPVNAYSGYGDMMVLKLNNDGIYNWHTFLGTSSQAGDIVANDSGVYVTGMSVGSWNGPSSTAPLHAYTGPFNEDLVVAKFNSYGIYQWHTFYGSDGGDSGQAIVVDNGNNVYITGKTNTTWNGPSTQNPLHTFSGFDDIVILKLTENGIYQWHSFYGSTEPDSGRGIELDSHGNIYIKASSKIIWEGPSSTPAINMETTDTFEFPSAILKLDNNGMYKWHTFNSYCDDLTIDSNDALYCAGNSKMNWLGPSSKPPLNPQSGEYNDLVIVKLQQVSPIFSDVSPVYWANRFIERLYHAGITGGCSASPMNYCPENLVTRDQMAIFLERGIRGSSFSPPNVAPTFGDTAGNFAETWIEVLKNDGITGGCGNGNYCPTSGVTRAQMAIFLERAMHGSSYTPPNMAPTFGDTVGSFAEDWIEALKNDAITTGCGNGNYCPDDIVTRAQMAVFLAKAFNLP